MQMQVLLSAGLSLVFTEKNLVDLVWEEHSRPDPPTAGLMVMDISFTGQCYCQKQNTVEPLLTAPSLQWPLLYTTVNPLHWPHLYNSHLSMMVTTLQCPSLFNGLLSTNNHLSSTRATPLQWHHLYNSHLSTTVTFLQQSSLLNSHLSSRATSLQWRLLYKTTFVQQPPLLQQLFFLVCPSGQSMCLINSHLSRMATASKAQSNCQLKITS